MKKLFIILLVATSLFSSCATKELGKEEALSILKKQPNYPRVIDYEVYCADPVHAKRMLDKGFEKDDFVTIQKKQTINNMGEPLITFTEKSNPYLLPTPEKDQKHHVQLVKIGDEEITDGTMMQTDNDKTASMEYTVVYKNLTPFAKLLNTDSGVPKKRKVYFVLSDAGWIIQKK